MQARGTIDEAFERWPFGRMGVEDWPEIEEQVLRIVVSICFLWDGENLLLETDNADVTEVVYRPTTALLVGNEFIHPNRCYGARSDG